MTDYERELYNNVMKRMQRLDIRSDEGIIIELEREILQLRGKLKIAEAGTEMLQDKIALMEKDVVVRISSGHKPESVSIFFGSQGDDDDER